MILISGSSASGVGSGVRLGSGVFVGNGVLVGLGGGSDFLISGRKRKLSTKSEPKVGMKVKMASETRRIDETKRVNLFFTRISPELVH